MKRALIVLTASLALVAGLSPAAQAERVTVTDPNESGSSSDTRRITVDHSTSLGNGSGRLVVRVRAGAVGFSDYFDLWIDTPRRVRNFQAEIRPETEYGPVLLVRSFGKRGDIGCRRWEARSVSGPDEFVLFSIPRRCLGNPGKVRVAVRSTYVHDEGSIVDWVPSRRTFTRWVPASA